MWVQVRWRALGILLLSSMLFVLIGGTGLIAQAGGFIRVCLEGPPACDFSDLREAVVKAPDRAKILIEEGSYVGPIIITKNLSLIGSGPDKVVINGGVIVVGPFEVLLKSFTVTKGLNGIQGQPPPGLPPQLSPRLTVENVIITGNAAYGVALFGYSRALLENATIIKNGIAVLGLPIGGGIAITGNASITLSGNILIQESGAYGISLAESAKASISSQVVIRKSGLSGVQLGGKSTATIEGLVSKENACYGVSVVDDARATIIGGRFERNAKAGLQVGGVSYVLPGCVTQGETFGHATASVTSTAIAANPIGVLVGDFSKDFEEAAMELISVTLANNGCDLVVDPISEKDVTLIGTPVEPCLPPE